MGWVAANLLIGNQQPVLLGNDNFTAAPSGTFATQDGYINISANQQKQWEDLADALGVPEFKTDSRFQERDTRKANRKLLTPLLEAKLKMNTTAYWVDLLNDKGIPSGDIVSLEAALTSEQAKHRSVIEEVKEKGIGPIKIFNMTAKFSKTPAKIDAPPPRLSAHTDEILKNLGYGQEDIKAFKEKGAI
jgi:crotonobetainyl-CoA:carnitine CoA-transferase CaiB-like acyl-CoA transferase